MDHVAAGEEGTHRVGSHVNSSKRWVVVSIWRLRNLRQVSQVLAGEATQEEWVGRSQTEDESYIRMSMQRLVVRAPTGVRACIPARGGSPLRRRK